MSISHYSIKFVLFLALILTAPLTVTAEAIKNSSQQTDCTKALEQTDIPPQAIEAIVRLLVKSNSPYFKYTKLSKSDKAVLTQLDVKPEQYPKNQNEFFNFVVQSARKQFSANPAIEKAVDSYLKHTVSNVTSALQPTNLTDTSLLSGDQDTEEIIRGFGYLLLPRWDKAYNDPEYLLNRLRQRSLSATGYPKFDPADARALFMSAFKKLSAGLDHEVVPIAHALTGSDANTLFLDIAEWVVSLKKNTRVRPNLLVFDDSYIAARGPLKMYRFFNRGYNEGPWTDFVIPAPYTWQTPDPQDLNKPLNEKELEALQFIESSVKSRGDIGGIIFEPVLTAKGVYFFRTNFVKALRDLCDKLNIPILADEIFTGGGRTGKAFSYLHYPGFVPDFVSYGKGLGDSGLAEVHRKNGVNPYTIDKLLGQILKNTEQYGIATTVAYKFFDSTIENTSDQFLRSAAIINRITDDHLIENAKSIGDYFLNRLDWFQIDLRKTRDDNIRERMRGLGLLFGIDHENRYAPVITMQKSDVDRMMRHRTLEIIRSRLKLRLTVTKLIQVLILP